MSVRNLARCALFVAAMTVCAWLAVPLPAVPVTMQSFALFLALLLLGGKYGSLVCGVYLLLGCVGAPVFSGFRGGAAVLAGPTGGFLVGFMVCTLTYWLLTAVFGKNFRAFGLVIGWVLCYGFGCGWLLLFYPQNGVSVWTAVGGYVLPFLLPDGIKFAAAYFLSKKLSRIV